MPDEFQDEGKLRWAIEFNEVSHVIERFGAWVVTTYGVECLDHYYPIEFSRVNESDWIPHVRQKTWVRISEFANALDYAKSLYSMRQKLSLGGRPLKVFLSHGSEDKSAIRELRHRLLAIGVEPWLDEEELLPGQNWKLEIERALRRSDVALVCLSKETVSKTGFVQREIKDALDAAAERPEGQIFIIPMRLNECNLPESLKGLQRVDLFQQDGFDRLTRAFDFFVASRVSS